MKREIEFRAISQGYDRWVYGYYHMAPSGNHYITKADGGLWLVNPETVGQFTNLKDTNGKNIYEGDIIKVDYGVGRIISHMGCFMIEWIDDAEAAMEFLAFSNKTPQLRGRANVEVVGNIYDNPEMRESN